MKKKKKLSDIEKEVEKFNKDVFENEASVEITKKKDEVVITVKHHDSESKQIGFRV